MPYLSELHYCAVCGKYLGMDDGDGLCSTHDAGWPPRDERGRFRPLSPVEKRYASRVAHQRHADRHGIDLLPDPNEPESR